MSIYKLSLTFADMLTIILVAIWIVYNIRKIDIEEILFNYAIISLSLYVAIGNLYYIYKGGNQ